jgi:hypothetical protein
MNRDSAPAAHRGRARRDFQSPYGLLPIPAKAKLKPVTGLKETRDGRVTSQGPPRRPTGKNNRRSSARVLDANQPVHMRSAFRQAKRTNHHS